MRRISRRLALTFILPLTLVAIPVAGCDAVLHPAAENLISVRGKVTDVAPDTTCTVKLLTDRGRLAADMKTTPEFARQFLVEGGHWKYSVNVACAGQRGSFRSQLYELTATNKLIDLGTIVLR